MRIIAGELGGRQFEAPKGHRTHPMSDKVRGGLFNALGEITNLNVLDAFAGSGALSFEALSRGASNVVAIDIDKRAVDAINKNAKSLALSEKLKAIRANSGSWSDLNPNIAFDIVLAAPPYDDLRPSLLQKLIRHCKEGGLYILDWPGKKDLPELEGLKLLNQKKYGDAQLVFYRRIV